MENTDIIERESQKKSSTYDHSSTRIEEKLFFSKYETLVSTRI